MEEIAEVLTELSGKSLFFFIDKDKKELFLLMIVL
jgi:hypothetical protein